MIKHKIVIIGGGPAGLAAAIAAYDAGVKDILVIERENRLGGILLQCIHNGFGLHRFKESLTGPEYADKYVREALKRNIPFLVGATVTDLSRDKIVTVTSPETGILKIKAEAVILAMGCRERSRGALNIPGSRPSGIFSAGTAQKFINVKGYAVGKRVVILGSGDIGLIMARRLTLEGAKVLAVCEIMPFSSGLKRNIEQCLNDFGIPLYLSHTITRIEGEDRVTGVVVSKVDEKKRPVSGTEMHFDCDTVLFSVGLIPENELSKKAGVTLSAKTKGAVVDQDRQTSADGIFACGNVLHVHDLADFVSEEAELTGKAAARYALGKLEKTTDITTECGDGVSYVVPQKITSNAADVKLFFRVSSVMKNCRIVVEADGKELFAISKPALMPGEMQTITLKKDFIGKAKNKITIKAAQND